MSRSRVPIVITLVLALIVSSLTRDWARAMRVRGDVSLLGNAGGSSSLANMNSFALALLLGGLRGPLVMILWTSSESQKNEKNLEDFDTKVEWIRLLQPEFDTVHIFQVWNKAYNISVQMASLSNKYATILDAIDYAERVEAQRPNNLNMLYAIGGIYFDKLGTSSEKQYYKTRVRAESLPHESKQKVARNDPGWRRIELDPVLDQKGMILSPLLSPKVAVNPKQSGEEWSNGSELQFLDKYQPFPFGVSTFGFGYNYFKRAQVLQSTLNQQHAQLSPMVVDSRPALALKNWEEDECERGRRLELQAFNHPIPEERFDLDVPTADLAVDAPFSATERPNLLAAVEAYDRASKLGPDAVAEYQRHLKNYTVNFNSYQSHIDEAQVTASVSAGDRDYLKAMLSPADQRKPLLASATLGYRKALEQAQRLIFKYYVDEELAARAFPEGIRRTNVEQLPTAMYEPVLARVQALSRTRKFDPSAEDRLPWERVVERIHGRMRHLEGK
ncbi:MAG TPA: hypothetical protein VF669_04265 [Tepidisphaeraceae bacterium]|jgi:hypothetical protein